MEKINSKKIKFIDIFAGIGGMRLGFEEACESLGYISECVLTSEIKPYAISVLKQNHPKEKIFGDITQVDEKKIPNFDILLAGFPCQAFSSAGKRLGFEDTRGTLFFDVLRILKEKRPSGFLLENVEGLVTHDKINKNDKIGNTLKVIINSLEALGYFVSWRVLNSKDFGVAQERKRIYITGSLNASVELDSFIVKRTTLNDILEKGLPPHSSNFIELLLKHFSVKELYGKSIRDKRGGKDNIHSWDIELKGETTLDQRNLLNALLKERRKKKWAEEYGIDWMDGMPLTLNQIHTFYDNENLEEMLGDLVKKGYLKLEHPKKKENNTRIGDTNLSKGYNIVSGKMSFEINKILDPKSITPTLVAMDMQHLFVVDGNNLRRLTHREGLRLFGYPEKFSFNVSDLDGFDLLGNTVVVPVVREVAKRLLAKY